MRFTGEYRIPAPRDAVWQALNDTEILKASIAQLEELEWTGERDLRTTIAARIGPMKARFRGTVALSEIEAPHSYVLTGQGEGGVAGFAKAVARVRLHEDGAETLFAYDCEAEMGGRLATAGGSIVKGLADRATDAFFERFADRLVVAIAARDMESREPDLDTEDLAARLRGLSGEAGATDDGSLPFAWSGAGARLADRLRELQELGLTEPAAGGATAMPGHPAHRHGMIPLDAGTALIAGGWAAMVGILLLLFAT